MSRSGYTYGYGYQWAEICYRGAVASALSGKRGQEFLREMLAALDAIPDKRLIANELEDDGAVCAIGSVGVRRGIDMTKLNPDDARAVSEAFGIATAMAREIVWMNDEGSWGNETPEERWNRMRDWVAAKIKESAP